MPNPVNKRKPAEPKRASESVSRGGNRAGAARREAIFAAALRLFRERGFHATSINDIGAAAGVTGPAIYRHFAGKDEVLAEAIREGSRRIAAVTREALSHEELSPREALEGLVRAHLQVALENADMYAAYVLELRHVTDEVRKPLRRSEGRLREAFKRCLQAVHPEMGDEEARTLVTMAVFSVASLCMVPSRLDDDALVKLGTERITGLLAGPRAD
jgi:AcrR family transcriptional regulator